MPVPAESPRPTNPASSGSGRSAIAQDVKIKGDLTSEGTVELMGEVEGKLTARSLVIGAGGFVKGTIMAETVEVRGKVEGQISCVNLTLRAAANVHADSNYNVLTIESGAMIQGRFTRSTS